MRSQLLAFRFMTIVLAVLFVGSLACSSTWAYSLEEEIELGKKLDEEILKQNPLSTDTQALAEINEYGQNLVKNVKRKEIKYHFRIIQDKEFNAFATPGGYVYFTERIWNALRKDERIGVLAHEIVHVDKRHALDAISKQQRQRLWLAVLLTAARANRTLTDITGILHSVYSLKYSRENEREADKVGVELLQKAGYNPAGLLLAMRKINRVQEGSGGQPPKVLSSHPSTPERMRYLEEMLVEMGVPVPPENVAQEQAQHRIGDITDVRGSRIEFVSSKTLRPGEVVWLMKRGWDHYFEKMTGVPAARAVVSMQVNQTYTAEFTLLPNARASDISKGDGVYDPPKPAAETSDIRLGTDGRIVSGKPLKRLDRFLARQTVWNADHTALQYDNTGYVVIMDPSTPTGYVAASRPAFDYSVETGAVLRPVTDANKARWLGPVISIGRGGGTIEVSTDRDTARLNSDLSSGKVFDVLVPAWDPKQSYESRVVGTAVLRSLGPKIVLQMRTYAAGWNIQKIQNGFDIYEAKTK